MRGRRQPDRRRVRNVAESRSEFRAAGTLLDVLRQSDVVSSHRVSQSGGRRRVPVQSQQRHRQRNVGSYPVYHELYVWILNRLDSDNAVVFAREVRPNK